MKPEYKQRIEQIKNGIVPQGYKNTKVGIVPSDWKEKTIKDIGTFSKGSGISALDLCEVGKPCIRYGDIYTEYNISFNKAVCYTSDEVANNAKPVSSNTLLFTCSGETALEIGKCVCYTGDETLYVGGDIAILKVNEKIVPLFLSYQQNQFPSLKSKARYGQGNSVVHIYSNTLSKLSVAFPKGIAEQARIAEILSTQDRLIELQEKLISQKQQQKKYLMQVLLTGKKRLHGFNDMWEEKKLGDLVSLIKGSQVNKEDLSEHGTYYCLNGGTTPSGYLEEWNTLEDTISISEGGNSCGYINYNKVPFWSGGHCYTLQNLSNNIRVLYLYYFLKTNEKQIMGLRVGSGLPNIQKSSLNRFIIICPPLPEQQAIADILTKADEEIELLKKQLAQLKLKQKAMQQLLLTGIVRVQ